MRRGSLLPPPPPQVPWETVGVLAPRSCHSWQPAASHSHQQLQARAAHTESTYHHTAAHSQIANPVGMLVTRVMMLLGEVSEAVEQYYRSPPLLTMHTRSQDWFGWKTTSIGVKAAANPHDTARLSGTAYLSFAGPPPLPPPPPLPRHIHPNPPSPRPLASFPSLPCGEPKTQKTS